MGSQLGAAKVESEPQNRCFGLQQNPREREKERQRREGERKGMPKPLLKRELQKLSSPTAKIMCGRSPEKEKSMKNVSDF